MKSLLLAVVGLSLYSLSVSGFACYKNAYSPSTGKPVHSCPDGYEKDGALCYEKCRDGFYGIGPVCWSHCPSGFKDTGLHCLKPDSYGRGAGYTERSKCNRKANGRGCNKNGALFYPRCRENFHQSGCCVCSPDCPSGMKDIGVSCEKSSYGRGVGKPLGCSSDERNSGGLCYS